MFKIPAALLWQAAWRCAAIPTPNGHPLPKHPHITKAACTPKNKVQAAFSFDLFGIGKYRADVQGTPGQECLRAHALAARRLQLGNAERVFAARHHDAVRIGR